MIEYSFFFFSAHVDQRFNSIICIKELFELIYNDEKLADKIKMMIDESQSEVEDIKEKKNNLFKQLDNLLIETFHTTPVIIDEQKLVNGEEGCLCNIDLEYIEKGTLPA